MQTRLDLPRPGASLRARGALVLRDARQRPIVERAFEALLGAQARGAFDGTRGEGAFRWLPERPSSAMAAFALELEIVPRGFWRVLCGMLEGRGVQALELRAAEPSPVPEHASSPGSALLDECVPVPPEASRFEFAVDTNPKAVPDRYVHLRFAHVLDEARFDHVAARLGDWHEMLWGGFCTGLDRLVPEFESVYPHDPYTLVSHVDPWRSDDDAWRVLLRIALDIDATFAPLVSVRVE